MVWSGNGVTYTELRQMDLAEYQECRQAKRLWVISIHALCEEGDSKNRDKISIFKQIIQHSARI